MGASLVYFLSLGLSIAQGVALFLGINLLLNGVGTIVGTTLIGELFGILSLCLPFSLVQLLSGFGVVAAAIISFLTTRKVFGILMSILGGATA